MLIFKNFERCGGAPGRGDPDGIMGEATLLIFVILHTHMPRRRSVQLLLPVETYLTAGVHVGTTFRNKDMAPFIYRVRPDRLNILDIKKTDERIRLAGKFLSYYEGNEIAVVGRRKIAEQPLTKFAEVIGALAFTDRFVPGTFTNPEGRVYYEPSLVIVTDPVTDKEAVDEAEIARIPVVAIANSGNSFSKIDLVIPANNRSRKSLAVIFFLLAREYMLNKGMIEKREDFPADLSDFGF